MRRQALIHNPEGAEADLGSFPTSTPSPSAPVNVRSSAERRQRRLQWIPTRALATPAACSRVNGLSPTAARRDVLASIQPRNQQQKEVR